MPDEPMPSTQKPYVSRSEAEEFLAAIAKAPANPTTSPTVFHICGIGGVGKTTLLSTIQESQQHTANLGQVSFGRTEGIDQPIPLMAKLYEQIAPHDAWSSDPFWERYDLYFETINTLETQPKNRLGSVDDTQLQHVKTLLRLGVDVAGKMFLPESQEKLAGQIVERGTAAAVAGLSLKDDVMQLLQQHRATKRNTALQKLMLEPLAELTQAFADGLKQQAQKRPVVLMLDTYEKVPLVLDTWLWRTLLGNTRLMDYPVRLVIAGRRNIRREEGWRKLHQDTNCIYERTFDKFTPEQTTDYLSQIGLTDETEIQNIYQVTRGLPYYLNWVREQREKNLPLNLTEGNQEIVRLLSEGLSNPQKTVVQLSACCRWFDLSVIRHLTEHYDLDFATAVDDTRNCFGWLIQQNFVEPAGNSWRVDDVARDVFRMALRQTDPQQFEQIHQQLADYFQRAAHQEVPPEAPPPDKYENPDWHTLQTEYLYHLAFARQPDFQTQIITNLLEARFFKHDELLQIPLQAILAEGALDDESTYLNYTTRQFLQEISPAIFYSWAVLEEFPIDYPYNQENYGLSKALIHKAIQRCLAAPDQLQGLAKFMACLCKAKRCSNAQQPAWLSKAQDQAKILSTVSSPDFVVDLYLWKLGLSLHNLGHYVEAIASYDKALNINPDDHNAWIGKGTALEKLRKYKEALISHNKALEIKPDDALGWYNKGVQLGQLGRDEEAIASYDNAVNINPNDHNSWNNRGNSLVNLGRYEEAIASYDKAVEVNPNDHNAWNNRGNSLTNLGRYEEAIASYDKAVEVNPDNHSAWYSRGNSLANLGRYQEAIASYDQAVEVNPDDHLAWYNRGISLASLGHYQEAIASYDKAVELKPDDHNSWNNRGNSLANLGRYEEAIASYDQAVEVNPDNHSAWYNRGNSLASLGHYQEAIASYDKAVELKPDNHLAWNNRGSSLHNLGRYQEAITSYNKAVELKPDNHLAWNNRGSSLHNLGRYQEAITSYNKAVELKPDKHEAWNNQGSSLANLGRYEEAIASYDKAVELKPDDHLAWNNRGNSLKNLGRYEEAIASYDKAVDIKPDDHKALANRGDIHRRLGQHQQALADLNHAIDLKPDYAWAIATRGQTYAQLQQYETALEDLDRTIEIDPDDTWAIGYRGELYLWLHRYQAALTAFNHALEKKSDSDWTLYCRALALALITNQELATEHQPPPPTVSVSDVALSDITQAIHLAQTEHQKDPTNWQTHFNLALYHLAADHPSDAHTLYETGLKTAPAWAITMAYHDLRDYLHLFPTNKTAQTWCTHTKQAFAP
ncbi:TPR repeat-containing protein [Leptolyngbya sp. PCC 7375]|nr:TPR repeat-containing protein [Leptolyngbya sp. PCC 7375]